MANDLDFLSKILAGTNPKVIENQTGFSPKSTVQYPFSPMDPQANDRSLLDALLSPQSIQAPIYNYNQTPQENMDQGSVMRGIENIPVMSSTLKIPDITQQSTNITPKPVVNKSNAVIPVNQKDSSAEALMSNIPKEMSAQTDNAEKSPSVQDMLSELQQNRRNDMATLAMLEAADRFGTALAGSGHLQYQGGKFDNLKGLANMPLEDFLTSDKFKKENEKFTLDTELSKMNLEKAKSQVNDDKAKSDPNSDISKVARASVIDSLNKIGRKDLAKTVTDKMSSKQIEDIFGQYNLTNMVTNFENQQNRMELAKMRGAEKADQNKAKMEEKDIKRLDAANKIVTASLSRNNTAFGKSANILRSAEAIEQLVGNNPNLDSRQITEVARNLDAMLSSGAATISGMKKLIPSTMSGDMAKIQEYISNHPQGAGQAEFVKRMMETVEREKALAKKQIQRESKKILSSYADLQKKQPEAWNTMIQAHGLPEDMFEPENKIDTSNMPEEIEQDGHIFKLNKTTGEYE